MGDDVTIFNWIRSLDSAAIKDSFAREGRIFIWAWHPPTYPYLAALLGKFVTINESTIRMIGIVSYLISVILIYAITYGLFRKDRGRESMAILACFLYVLNPLAVRGSLLIDLDAILDVRQSFTLRFVSFMKGCSNKHTSS